jgi:hypothetical protein
MNFLYLLPCQYLMGNLKSDECLLIFYATELIKKTRTVMILETGNESEDNIRRIAVEIIFIIKLQELNYCPCFESHDHYNHFV